MNNDNIKRYIDLSESSTPPRNARLVCVTSGKGGVGKSNFILNLAIALSIKNKKVLLIDADINLSNLDILTGLYPEYSINDLVDKGVDPQKLLLDGPRGVKILPAASGSFNVLQNLAMYQKALIQAYHDLQQDFDYILIDTGAGISDYTVDFVVNSESIVVLTTPEPTAITDAYAMIKILCYRLGAPDIMLVVNMLQTEEEGKTIYSKVKSIVQQFLGKNVRYAGGILQDSTLPAAVREQVPMLIKNPRSKFSVGVLTIAQQLLDEE